MTGDEWEHLNTFYVTSHGKLAPKRLQSHKVSEKHMFDSTAACLMNDIPAKHTLAEITAADNCVPTTADDSYNGSQNVR